VVYDATVSFCERFLDKRSRTVDQMVQAARSGRQNIAEGSRASATSSQTELRLVNVARASLDELLLDYEDFIRQRGHSLWSKEDPVAKAVRAVWRKQPAQLKPGDCFGPYRPWLTHSDPCVVANAVICLIHQTNYLLDRQIASLERNFVQEGGYSERLAAARIAERRKQSQTNQSDPTNRSNPSDITLPNCPVCGQPMALRTARQGPRAGSQFLGCSGYPDCKGTRPLEPVAKSESEWGMPQNPRHSLHLTPACRPLSFIRSNRRLDGRGAISGHIAIAEVAGINQNDIGR
jgi:four helix bundle suffix protein